MQRTRSGTARHGRDDDFVAFVRDAQPRLRRVAYLMSGNWHTAEDVVQASLVKLYLHWGRVDRESDPWAYARRTVVNAAIDDRRRPWHRETVTDVLPDVGASAPDGLDDALLAALSELSGRQRAVVVLRYVEDLDAETVAALLSLPVGTVKSHAARGLTTLRARLSGDRVATHPRAQEIR